MTNVNDIDGEHFQNLPSSNTLEGTMKDYLMLFRNVSGNGDYITTTEDMAADMPAWQSWIGNIAAQSKLISTQPMEWTGAVVSRDGTSTGPSLGTDRRLVAGYLLCKSDNEADVQDWARTCPIMKYPQASVEVRGLIPFASN